MHHYNTQLLQHEHAGSEVQLHVMEFLMHDNSLFLFTFSLIISGRQNTSEAFPHIYMCLSIISLWSAFTLLFYRAIANGTEKTKETVVKLRGVGVGL
jgi:hypothetical protein